MARTARGSDATHRRSPCALPARVGARPICGRSFACAWSVCRWIMRSSRSSAGSTMRHACASASSGLRRPRRPFPRMKRRARWKRGPRAKRSGPISWCPASGHRSCIVRGANLCSVSRRSMHRAHASDACARRSFSQRRRMPCSTVVSNAWPSRSRLRRVPSGVIRLPRRMEESLPRLPRKVRPPCFAGAAANGLFVPSPDGRGLQRHGGRMPHRPMQHRHRSGHRPPERHPSTCPLRAAPFARALPWEMDSGYSWNGRHHGCDHGRPPTMSLHAWMRRTPMRLRRQHRICVQCGKWRHACLMYG